ncbi:MAG: AAA family ATPase [Gammaproteobacteria bacterium]|nr:AAA family ATPase [Gammaproteobacteria bacterium]
MYQQFFGFDTLPFKITPDERVFFAGAHRQEMLDALLYGIERGEGFITVVGEVGIGKTTLARVLSNRFSDCFSIISIFTPNVTALDMLRLIAQEVGLNPSSGASKAELMQLIRAYCLQLHQQGRRFLLLIDEAQTMLIETIEELRLLSNMQVDDIKLVQVLLFGQPELDRMLNSPELRQVKDRVLLQLNIAPFSRDELADYLDFRLQQAGYKGQYFFSDAVVDAIYKKSQGYARAVNRLADQALMAAFAEQTHQVQVDHVESSNQEAIQPLVLEEAVKPDITDSVSTHPKKHLKQTLIAVSVLAVLIWIGSEVIQYSQPSSTLTETKTDSITMPAKPEAESAVPIHSEIASVEPPVNHNETEMAVVKINSQQESVQPTKEADILKPVSQTTELPIESWLRAGRTDSEWQEIHQQQFQYFQALAVKNKYTIQLISSPWRLRDAFVQEALRIVSQLPKSPAFYYDYSVSLKRLRIAVIYGVYDSREDANQALKDLAEMNKGYRPELMSYKKVVELMSKSQVFMGSSH